MAVSHNTTNDAVNIDMSLPAHWEGLGESAPWAPMGNGKAVFGIVVVTVEARNQKHAHSDRRDHAEALFWSITAHAKYSL